MWSAVQNGHRARGLLSLAAVRDSSRQQDNCQGCVDINSVVSILAYGLLLRIATRLLIKFVQHLESGSSQIANLIAHTIGISDLTYQSALHQPGNTDINEIEIVSALIREGFRSPVSNFIRICRRRWFSQNLQKWQCDAFANWLYR